MDNNPDVEAAYGTRSTAATTHYIQHGFSEGRNDDPPIGFPPGFDGLQYIASHPDLIEALGADRFEGERHYLAHGRAKSRERRTRSSKPGIWLTIRTFRRHSATAAALQRRTTSNPALPRDERTTRPRVCPRNTTAWSILLPTLI